MFIFEGQPFSRLPNPPDHRQGKRKEGCPVTGNSVLQCQLWKGGCPPIQTPSPEGAGHKAERQ